MDLKLKAILCVVPVILCGATAAAQEAPTDEEASPPQGQPEAVDDAGADAEGPDSVELLRAAESAVVDLKSLTYSARFEGFGATATRSPVFEGRVEARRFAEGDASGWLFKIDGRLTAAGATTTSRMSAAFDGKAARGVDEGRKLVTEATGAEVSQLLEAGPGRIFNWMPMWTMLVSELLADGGESLSVSYEGRAVVGGVECEVVRQDTSEFSEIEEYVVWWFLGADDHLPRRMDSFYLEVDGVANGLDVLTITDLKPGAEVPDSALALAAPEGYQVQKVEPRKTAARGGGGGVVMAQGASKLVGKPAPAWTLKDQNGIEHSLADYRGKVVVIDFWATWCGYCKLAMPALQTLHEKYRGLGVEVVGITVWEAGDPVKYMKDHAFTYGLLLNGDEVAPAYGIQGIPRLIVVGKDGTVIHDATGYDENAEANLGAVIDRAIGVE